MMQPLRNYWLTIFFVITMIVGNLPRNIGGLKGDLYQAGFPFVFAEFGDYAEGEITPSHFILNLSLTAGIAFVLIAWSNGHRKTKSR